MSLIGTAKARRMTSNHEWRCILRAVRSARATAFLGSKAAAFAAAAELVTAPFSPRFAVACVLAAQAAKNQFLTDIEAFSREIEASDRFREEMASRGDYEGRAA